MGIDGPEGGGGGKRERKKDRQSEREREGITRTRKQQQKQKQFPIISKIGTGSGLLVTVVSNAVHISHTKAEKITHHEITKK